VPAVNLTAGDQIMIGVKSFNDCKFSIIATLEKEVELTEGVAFVGEFNAEQTKLFKFQVPLSTDASPITSITVSAAPIRFDAKDLDLKVWVDNEEEGYSLRGVPAWRKGSVVRLQEDDFAYFCTGCTLMIEMDVYDSGRYHLKAKTNVGMQRLYDNEQVDDIVEFQERQCYSYYVKEADTDVQAKITTYSGKNTFYAGSEFVDGNITGFVIGDPEEEILDVRPWLRNHKWHKQTGDFYFCVFGELTSTFTVKVHEFKENQSREILEDGYTETFHLGRNRLHKHLYKVPSIEYIDEDF